MRRKKKDEKQSIRMVATFVVLVLFFIVVSLAFKAASLIGKSTFDGAHQFIIKIVSKEKSEVKIISFAPDANSISILALPKDGGELKITTDGTINMSFNANLSTSGKDVGSDLQTFILHNQRIKTNLTMIDLARLYLFTKTVPASNFTYKESFLPLSDDETGDKILSSLFTDYSLSRQGLAIEIVNGTDTPGLGGRLARLIGNMGGNVISVSTSEKPIKTSQILYVVPSYTVDRLAKVLNMKKKQVDKPMLFDIVIQIGKD